MEKLLTVVLILMAFPAFPQGQATVYKTVDEQGVVSFSDTPPAKSEGAEQLQINTPAPQPTGEYQQNLDAMRETTDRMAEDRREREKHRAEMRELQARTDAYQQPATPDLSEYHNYYPQYGGGYYRPGRPPYRPGLRPRPEHPIANPPRQPGEPRPLQGNSQLMRPIIQR